MATATVMATAGVFFAMAMARTSSVDSKKFVKTVEM
jgi:hypothetical protein